MPFDTGELSHALYRLKQCREADTCDIEHVTCDQNGGGAMLLCEVSNREITSNRSARRIASVSSSTSLNVLPICQSEV